MPSYGNFNIFGRSVRMQTTKRERSEQANEYFGLTGIESLDGGGRGFITEVNGVYVAASPGDLGSLFNVLWSYSDGVARDLVDMYGLTWIYVKLVKAGPAGKPSYDPSLNRWVQPYSATFFHLI